MTDAPPYRPDVSSIARFTVATTIAGSAVGAVVGMARSLPARNMAFSVGLQSFVFTSSFFAIREVYRKLTHVQSWRDDWYVINTLSAGTGAGIAASLRTAGVAQRPPTAVAMSCAMGSLLGFGGSLAYRALDVWRVREGQRLSAERAQKQGGPQEQRKEAEPAAATADDAKKWFDWRRWSPIRRISKEEAEEKRRLAEED